MEPYRIRFVISRDTREFDFRVGSVYTFKKMPRVKSPDLKVINIRLKASDVRLARQIARTRTIPYQHVIRGWVSDGAAKAKAGSSK